jgi:DNA helicase-2/ATP-dependent DNA helicase PcrA
MNLPTPDEIDRVLTANLTTTQRAAAIDAAREVLTLACAGSGKSRTLAYRIARLIAEGNEPNGIVAFTFTEKAAEAIKVKVAAALAAVGVEPTVLGAMYIGTIHSYCQYLLAQMDARYRQFEVLDDNRLKLYLMSRYPALGIQQLRTARQARNARGQMQLPGYFDTVRAVADAWKLVNDELILLNAVRTRDAQLGQTLETLRDRMAADHFIDFSLMIRNVVDALRANDAGVLRVVSGLRHLMVDEYQDVNPAQEALIRELHTRSETLFVVGDDDQSIYAWRGADVSNILTFDTRYPTATVHTLSSNFRSTSAIVAAADAFVAGELGATRITKNPVAANDGTPRDFRRLWFPVRADEADWVGDRVAALLGTAYVESDGTTRGLTPADIGILMRSTRGTEGNDGPPRHAAFTGALTTRGIPYTLETGGGIFDRPQVDVLRQTFGLLRDSSPSREVARAHFDAVVLPAFPDADFNQMAGVLADWGRRIHAPRDLTRRRVYPQELVHDLLAAVGVARRPLDPAVMRDVGVFSRMIQDVEAVYVSIDSADRFQQILNFLNWIAEEGYDSTTDDVLLRPDAVTVSTVHRMKGLEFPVVFVVDVEGGRFPANRRAYQGWLPQPIVQAALARGAYQSTRNEEVRLFYTAITRAEKYLHVSGTAQLPGGARARQRSAFAQRLTHPEINDSPQGLPVGLTPSPPRRRIDETVVPTSYSEIRYYLRCPQDYRFRKNFGFSPPIPDMFGFGMTVHATVGKLHEQFPTATPTLADADQLAREMFHLKHVPQSRDPANNPGPYERAKDRAAQIASSYAGAYGPDFQQARQVEARFEVPVQQAVISGSIDLLLREDPDGNILEARVIDFKTMEGGETPTENEELHWTELALQVQLYAKAARDVLGENARTGAVHLLKDGQRVEVPVDDAAVGAAVANVEWAIERVLAADFPMRPERQKCDACDFQKICPKRPEPFATAVLPPPISIPAVPGTQMARAFSEFEGTEPQDG